MKLKIVVVDDESPIREWLAYCIKNASGDYLTYTAANGMEALNLIREEHPDVVFTDIRMPVMDGLELTQKIRSEQPRIKVVILTNYADFAYAKQAISNGAAEYILKSEMRAADINAFLKRALSEKEKIQNSKIGGIYPDGQLDLYELYGRRDKPESARAFLQGLGYIDGVDYRICCMRNDNTPKFWTQMSRIAHSLTSGGQALVLSASEKQYEFIIMQSNTIQAVVQELIELIPGERCLGISSVSGSIDDFFHLLEEAETALRYSFFGQTEGIIDYTQLISTSSVDRTQVIDRQKNIMRLMSIYHFEEAKTELEQWFSYVKDPSGSDSKWVEGRCQRMLLSVEEQYIGETKSAIQQISVPDTLEQCRRRCINLTEKMDAVRMSSNSPSIDTALQYIRDHYSENISLADVAGAVYRSPEYFSRQFKEAVGENFSAYLTIYRLERAQELLCTTQLNIFEVAARVGYTSASYFSRIYKKYKGIAPEQERMSKK